jgi:hypothetical protein
MTEPCPASPLPPAWIHKRDGRLVPFEPDRITRALFAATEALGQPDAFLARELTDGVVHFLATESESGIPTTAEVADLVIKVVRELGHPALAAAFAEGKRTREKRPQEEVSVPHDRPLPVRFSPHELPEKVVRDCLRRYTLQAVFARHVVAARDDGLLHLTDLETPLALAGLVLGLPPGGQGIAESIEAAAPLAARLVLDGPEYALSSASSQTATALVREVALALRLTDRSAVVNLNCKVAPPWADHLAAGPLFAEQHLPHDPQRLAQLADELLEQLLASGLAPQRLRIDWHLGEQDFQPESVERLHRLTRRALHAEALAFVFDRPRRPIALAEGIDRKHPALLLGVGLQLPALARHPGVHGDADLFLQKLGSLTRLALSAAVQKREFLRRHSSTHPEVTRGFLLDRARTIASPLDLDSAVRQLRGQSVCSGAPALELAGRVAQRLAEVLRQEGQACQMGACLDSLPAPERNPEGVQAFWAGSGVTPWDETAPAKGQLRAADALQTAAGAGTAVLLLSEEQQPAAEQIAGWLRWAWQHTDIARLRLLRPTGPYRQLTLRMFPAT